MRAQYRQIEEMTDEVICCEEVRSRSTSHIGTVIELTSRAISATINCPFCGRSYSTYVYAVANQDYAWVSVGEIHIEEGV